MLDIQFPAPNSISNLTDIEQAKILFRVANAQFKKALEFYTLEKGYLKEHIEIKQDMSKLYKYLALMEAD